MFQTPTHLLSCPDAFGQNLFEILPAHVRERLDAIKEPRAYPPGGFVYRQDDRVEGVYQLVEGEWKAVHSDSRGFRQVLEFIKPGTVTGIIPLLDAQPAFFGIQSLKRSHGFFIPGAEFRRWVLPDPAGLDAVLNHFGMRIRRLIDTAHGLTLHTVPERLAQLLLREQRMRPESLLLEFQEDQGDIGLLIGCTRAAVCRGLKLLADMGLIRNTFPVVKIIDLPRLERVAGVSPKEIRLPAWRETRLQSRPAGPKPAPESEAILLPPAAPRLMPASHPGE